jgi:hypothetical protein
MADQPSAAQQMIVHFAPSITINPADAGWVSPALEPAQRRR